MHAVLAAELDKGTGKLAHHARCATAVDEMDRVRVHGSSEGPSSGEMFWRGATRRAAEDADAGRWHCGRSTEWRMGQLNQRLSIKAKGARCKVNGESNRGYNI